jgi:hypothetical protein
MAGLGVTGGWGALTRELDAWTAAGRQVDVWWRDDDARTRSAALDRLVDLAAGLPLLLAVVPDGAEPFATPPALRVAQHGIAHTNRAIGGQKKIELANRPAAAIAADLAAGAARLSGLFGAAWRPVLVPPWNRIDPALLALLPGIGFRALSTYGQAAGGPMPQVNCHIDPIDWRGGRGFAGKDAVLTALVRVLQVRRKDDMTEPVGLLTHHLAHDEPLWRFLSRLLETMRRHAAVNWPSVDDIFGLK